MKSACFAALLGTMVLTGPLMAEDRPVAREEVSPQNRMAMDVLSRIYSDLDDIVGPDKPLQPEMLLRVMLVAKQKAAAETCEGFEIDEARYNKVMETALSNLSSADPTGEMFDRVMMGFATGYGAELAFAAFDPDSYCAFAAELRDELAEDTEGLALVWKDAP